MKLATKFALAFIGCGLLSVLVYSAVAAGREVDRLESAVSVDLLTMGRTLGRSALDVWRRDGLARAMEVVGEEDREQEPNSVDVHWTWLDVEPGAVNGPRGGDAVIPALRRGEPVTWTGADAAGAGLVYAYVPLLRPGERPAALELSRPLASPFELFFYHVRGQLVAFSVYAGFMTVLAIGLTTWIVTTPLARLTEQARRIGAGDLSSRLPVRGGDEVATLVRELNAMCDQLKDARERVEQEAEKRVAAIDQLRHADRLRTVGTLASGIAHELGTPLSVISMRAKMIATGEVAGDEVPSSAKVIVAQTERVTRIVRQLLDFARRRAPNRAETDIGELADRTAQLLGALAKKARVELEVRHAEPVRAHVDPTQIEQAITNLVMNAVQAMPDGGTVKIVTRQGTARERRCAVIEVEDTGTGIAKEDVSRVFEPFFTTKAVGDGTGLGLSVTHGIVADHEGWMEVESDVGKGTSFKIYLPVQKE